MKRHYRVDKRELRRLNDKQARQDSKRTHGGYEQWAIEIVPIKDIAVPKVWKPNRFAKALQWLKEGKSLDPIRLSREGGGKWQIGDGIHRTNASMEMGYTHVPAYVAEWVRTPDEYVPEEVEKAQVPIGGWVQLRKAHDRRTVAWVEDQLGQRDWRGVKRHRYGLALIRKGDDWPDFVDFTDNELDPLPRPPSWAVDIQKQIGVGSTG